MPIIFISYSKSFIDKIKSLGFDGYVMNIKDYQVKRKTYYISPANSLCFMDGGIDKILSGVIFPNIEKEVKQLLNKYGETNLLGRKYLPIGSSMIIEKGEKNLIVAPTMLLPQNVKNTNNAYYATMAILYNLLINKKEDLNKIDVLFTSLCCGYGKMQEDESIKQIIKGINDYKDYKPNIINENIIIYEPNLNEQPKYYQNTEFFNINPKEIINV